MGENFSGAVPTLSPLRTLAWGLLFVVVDLRIQEIDLVPDPIGWALGLVASLRLTGRHGAFRASAAACAVGLACSLPQWLGVTGVLLTTVVGLVETVLVFATCTAVMALVPQRRSGADTIRWWDLGLSVGAGVALALALQQPDLGLLALLLGLAQLVTLVCFLVLLFRAAGGSPTSPGKTLWKTP